MSLRADNHFLRVRRQMKNFIDKRQALVAGPNNHLFQNQQQMYAVSHRPHQRRHHRRY